MPKRQRIRMLSFPLLRNSASPEKRANIFPAACHASEGGRDTIIAVKIGSCLLPSCTTLYTPAWRKEAINLIDHAYSSLFPPGKGIRLWGLAGAWGRRITVCHYHDFSFSTNPWSRSPGKFKFGAPVIFGHDPCSRKNLLSLVRREEFFIPILTHAEQWAASPRWLEEHRQKENHLLAVQPYLLQQQPLDCLTGTWNSKISWIHFQPDALNLFSVCCIIIHLSFFLWITSLHCTSIFLIHFEGKPEIPKQSWDSSAWRILRGDLINICKYLK